MAAFPIRFATLEKLGAERCEIERPDLSKQIRDAKKIDAVLDLVGNSVMLDSLAMLRCGGRSCLAGWLGGILGWRNAGYHASRSVIGELGVF